MNFFVAGVKFHKFHEIKDELEEGFFVQLVPEPSNKYDKFAVKVLFKDTMLGYVPKTLSEIISNRITSQEILCEKARIIKLSPESESWTALKVEMEEDKDG